MSLSLRLLLVFIVGLTSVTAQADELKVAVAANFKSVLEVLAQRFTEKQKHDVVISSASSGAIYNQIANGAPYDLFLSADSKRPAMLEHKGLVLKNSRRPYAYGRLVLWDRSGKVATLSDLKSWKEKLAIANPATAPYGVAAQETLEKLGLWSSYKSRVIQGTNIQQTWVFIDSGNASVGMVAWSQLVDRADQRGISFIPDSYHKPIRQELVALKSTRKPEVAQQFIDFLMSADSQQYIASHGYRPVVRQRGKG